MLKYISYLCVLLTILLYACKGKLNNPSNEINRSEEFFEDSLWVDYEDITGIGYEEGISRRDPSDIIKLGNKYYIWYTRIPARTEGENTSLYNSGYYGTIWYAISQDEGQSWIEMGEALGTGEKGKFDSHAVFTPNILYVSGNYYLFYTAVKPTSGNSEGIFENNSQNDYTAIGVAVSDSPDGPFIRSNINPVIIVSKDSSAFDSYRVDDAALLVRNGRYWLYYKGRSIIHGLKGPSKTKMGVAFASNPEGPYKKYDKAILDRSHEVLIWNYRNGVKTLASISSTIEFAPDGLKFETDKKEIKLKKRPSAPGLYRPHLTKHSMKKIPGWGISMSRKNGDIYLLRFEFKNN